MRPRMVLAALGLTVLTGAELCGFNLLVILGRLLSTIGIVAGLDRLPADRGAVRASRHHRSDAAVSAAEARRAAASDVAA